jgi:hypothetical protein
MEGAGVGWQDELRRLDEELAAGRLSAEEYRQLRDALLTPPGGQPPDSGQPEGNQQSSSPFPPPFKWDSDDVTTRMTPKPPPSQGDAYEQTQRGPGQLSDAERTQVVPGPSGPVPPGPPLNQPLGYSVPSWQQVGNPGQHVPWAGQDLPPIGQEPSWLRQGPEAFDTEHRSSTRMIVTVIAVLALLGGGAALYWFVFGGAENQPASTASRSPSPTATATATTTTVPKPAGPFVELDGRIVVNDTYSMDDAAKAGRPARSEINTLTEGGTETVTGFVTETGGLRTGIWTFKPSSDAAAKGLLEDIDRLYHRAKYKDLPNAPAGVRALYLPAPDGSPRVVYRAHYVYAGLVVRVEAYGGNDPKAVEQKFNELLDRQLKNFPPSES